ncbi:MAG: type II toxin-antitoxin system HicB family antitoxin [Lachnospiraceae bacterium]|nr:type II toxin-antitoxin system HicB family antitoxin [Lachnospiraceae bacterium]
MKEVYQVIFTKQKKGNYLVEVPDLDCLTEGKNLSDAIKMARDVIGIKGITLEDMGEKIPKATNNINIKKGIFYNDGDSTISYVDVDFDDYRRSIDNKMVRRNVTLPNWMDRFAEKKHLNVSKILQDAINKLVETKHYA